MKPGGAALGALLGVLALGRSLPGYSDSHPPQADTLWQMQRELLEEQSARISGAGDARVSPDYLGWPPGAAEPLASHDIRSWIPEPDDEGYRCDDLTLTGFTQSTDTALLFWNTRCIHPTDDARPEFQYASASVWVFADTGWQLLAHLGRRKPAREAERYEQASDQLSESLPALPSVTLGPPATVEGLPSARDVLWAAEQEILGARGRNDFGPYLHYASEYYLAWPPDVPTPMNIATLRRMIGGVTGLENERKTHRFAGYTQVGGTAVVYWHTHRTRTRAGAAVDHHNATTGVWSFEDGAWRLLGVLSRRKSPTVLRGMD